MIRHSSSVVAQRNVHEDVAKRGFEGDHQGFGVFAGLVALLRGEEERGMYPEMKALVVERGDGVAHDLIREFEDGFLDQRVGLRQFGARVVAGHLDGSLRLEVEYDPAFDIARQRNRSEEHTSELQSL